MIKENLESMEARIREACAACGRDRSEVLLLPVSKTKPVEMIYECMDEGFVDFGENYVQELCEKYEIVKQPVRWHLIGHLQRNKVKYIVDKVAMIHSVDSLALAKEIQKEALKKGVDRVPILIEVNMAEEESKSGLHAEDALETVQEIAKLPNVAIRGLMTIAPFVEDPEDNRPVFRQMKELARQIDAAAIPGVEMKELSMGMTNDFAVAIEEGATMIRVGTAIFGAREYHK